MSFGKKFKLDRRDKEIVTYLQAEPLLTEEELARRLGLTPEVVGARITKLLRANLLEKSYGVSFRKTGLFMARVDFYASNPEQIMEQFRNCPFGVNLFKMSGELNFSLLVAGVNMRQVEGIVDACLRTNPKVQNIKTHYIMNSVRDFPVKLNFDLERIAKYGCLHACEGAVKDDDLIEIIGEIGDGGEPGEGEGP
ncbi:MAG: Lrp/AsnC family transcriptional regulator [Promethearchaeota archaeon]